MPGPRTELPILLSGDALTGDSTAAAGRFIGVDFEWSILLFAILGLCIFGSNGAGGRVGVTSDLEVMKLGW